MKSSKGLALAPAVAVSVTALWALPSVADSNDKPQGESLPVCAPSESTATSPDAAQAGGKTIGKPENLEEPEKVQPATEVAENDKTVTTAAILNSDKGVDFSGSGFTPNEKASVTVIGPKGTQYTPETTLTVDEEGRVSGTYYFTRTAEGVSVPSGTYSIVLEDKTSGKQSKEAAFTVAGQEDEPKPQPSSSTRDEDATAEATPSPTLTPSNQPSPTPSESGSPLPSPSANENDSEGSEAGTTTSDEDNADENASDKASPSPSPSASVTENCVASPSPTENASPDESPSSDSSSDDDKKQSDDDREQDDTQTKPGGSESPSATPGEADSEDDNNDDKDDKKDSKDDKDDNDGHKDSKDDNDDKDDTADEAEDDTARFVIPAVDDGKIAAAAAKAGFVVKLENLKPHQKISLHRSFHSTNDSIKEGGRLVGETDGKADDKGVASFKVAIDPATLGNYTLTAKSGDSEIASTSFAVITHSTETDGSDDDKNDSKDENSSDDTSGNSGSGTTGRVDDHNDKSSGGSTTSGNNTGSGSGSSQNSGVASDLPRTGAELTGLALGVALLSVGVAAVVVTRRRSHGSDPADI